jgi:urease accessory protein
VRTSPNGLLHAGPSQTRRGGLPRDRAGKADAADDLATPAAGHRDWLVWQLIDSAFPAGGFAHSLGLEAARQQAEVQTAHELVSYSRSSLRQWSHAAVPFVVATHREPAALSAMDELFDAFTPNHVANRASRNQGRAFRLAAQRVLPGKGGVSSAGPGAPPGPSPFGHFAPVYGAVLGRLELPLDVAVRMFVFNQLRSLLAAAVRLNIVGPLEAQSIQHQLAGAAEECAATGMEVSMEDIAQTAPLLDLWQGGHDRMYSRLFQS